MSLHRERRTTEGPRQLQYETCGATGKRGFFSRRDARKARNRMPSGGALSVFRCDVCSRFHLGHLPIGVRAGAIARDAYREAHR